MLIPILHNLLHSWILSNEILPGSIGWFVSHKCILLSSSIFACISFCCRKDFVREKGLLVQYKASSSEQRFYGRGVQRINHFMTRHFSANKRQIFSKNHLGSVVCYTQRFDYYRDIIKCRPLVFPNTEDANLFSGITSRIKNYKRNVSQQSYP